jgi:hypothetical protein
LRLGQKVSTLFSAEIVVSRHLTANYRAFFRALLEMAAFAQALRHLISDRAERQRLAMNARAAAAQLPRWQDSARLFAGAIEMVG